jgi:hypothetical protein
MLGMSKNKWAGKNVAVLATGPSLVEEDVVAVRDAGFITVAVNHAWTIAPWCDVIYAGDGRYWRAHYEEIDKTAPKAKRYSKSANAHKKYRAIYAKTAMKGDYNSGQMALEYALRQGPKLIVMLGFDVSLDDGFHFHGSHEKTPNPNKKRIGRWVEQFSRIPNFYNVDHVINCSRKTALTMFKRESLEDVLSRIS